MKVDSMHYAAIFVQFSVETLIQDSFLLGSLHRL